MKRAVLPHPADRWRVNADLDGTNGHGTKMSPQNGFIPLAESQVHVINPAYFCGAFDDGVEHRLHVGRRAADDAKHLGRGRLMFQGFTQLRIALLDLFIREWSNFSAADRDQPNRVTLTQQRRDEQGAGPGNRLNGVRELLTLCRDVMYVYRLAVDDGSSRGPPPSDVSHQWPTRHRPIYRSFLKDLIISAIDYSILRFT